MLFEFFMLLKYKIHHLHIAFEAMFLEDGEQVLVADFTH